MTRNTTDLGKTEALYEAADKLSNERRVQLIVVEKALASVQQEVASEASARDRLNTLLIERNARIKALEAEVADLVAGC